MTNIERSRTEQTSPETDESHIPDGDFRVQNERLNQARGYTPQTPVGEVAQSSFNFLKTVGGKVVAGVGAVAIAAGVGFVGAKAMSNEAPERPPATSLQTGELPGDEDGNGTVDSKEFMSLSTDERSKLNDQIEAMYSVDQFEDQAIEARLENKASDLQKNKLIVAGYIKEMMVPRDKAVMYTTDYDKPRDQWSDQDYLNDNTLGLFATTFVQRAAAPGETSEERQARLEKNKEYAAGAKKLFSIVSDKNVDGYRNVLDSIGKPETINGIINTYKAIPLNKPTDMGAEFIAIAETLRTGNNPAGLKGRLVNGKFTRPEAALSEASKEQFMLFLDFTDSNGLTTSVLYGTFTNGEAREFIEGLKSGNLKASYDN